jgi:hypothetical protein
VTKYSFKRVGGFDGYKTGQEVYATISGGNAGNTGGGKALNNGRATQIVLNKRLKKPECTEESY